MESGPEIGARVRSSVAGASGRGVVQRFRDAPPATLLLLAAVLISGGLLLHYLSRLTFWRDEWAFLLHRRGLDLDVFLDPFVEHLLAIPILIYKVLVTTFGMDSAAPFQFVAIALFLLSVVLVFVYLRRCVGGWLALAGVLPILFLGRAWDDLLFPFQMAFYGSMAAGLGALLALDREDRRGDMLATVLLTVSLLFSGLGIPFVAAVTVDVGLTRERFRRAFIVAVPTAIFGLWYLGWGREAETFISLDNLLSAPGYIFDGYASSVSALLGLASPRDEFEVGALDWGRPLFALALGFGIWRMLRLEMIPRRLWAVLALGTGFWFLTALNASVFGAPTVGRYQYVGVIFALLIAAELLRGVRIGWRVIAVVFSCAVLAALANFNELKDAAGGLSQIAQRQRGGLAALELIRNEVDPSYVLTEENSDVDYLGELDAASYFSAIDDYGSPAYTPEELAGSSELARIAADKVLASGLPVGPSAIAETETGECSTVRAGRAPQVVTLPPRGAILRADAEAQARLRRYASSSFPVDVGSLPDGKPALLDIPTDRSTEPWELELTGAGEVAVCER